MNNITVVGNISEPRLAYTKNQQAVLSFGLATTRMVKDQKYTTWHDIKVWDTFAENLVEHIKKGDRLIVVGRIQKEQWDDKDGVKQTRTVIVADEAGPTYRFSAEQQASQPLPEEPF
jgi:single-strand DNA-binding protein